MNNDFDNAITDREMTRRRELRDLTVEELRLVGQHNPPPVIRAVVDEAIARLEGMNPYMDSVADTLTDLVEEVRDDAEMSILELRNRFEIAWDRL